jgi:hypothetical protein
MDYLFLGYWNLLNGMLNVLGVLINYSVKSQLVKNCYFNYLGFILEQFKCEQGLGYFCLMGYNPKLYDLKSFLVI